ncbi:hypothetical protein HDU90_008566 [Geranomyces variabilis]|nr:hypothetical protein HDU90_008566 [Geranomyces variabilis]
MDLDEGVRLALSVEEPVATPPPSGQRIVLSRENRRWSVVDDVRGVRIDLTEATTSGVRSHEVEVEAVHGKGDVDGSLSTVGSIVGALGTFKGPHHAVRTAYTTVLGLRHPMFVGAQVTEKLDFERGNLLLHADGTANVMPRILEDNPLPTAAAAGASTVAPVRHVLDVEVDRIGRTVHAFDLLLHDGKDLRGSPDEPLMARLARLRDVVATQPLTGGWRLVEKPYHSYRWGMRTTLDSLIGPQSDGLIFVPEADPYPVRHHDLALCVGDVNDTCVPFRPQLPLSSSSRARYAPQPGDIVECALSGDVLRVHKDKPRPNFRTVAIDIWKSLKHPVDLQSLNLSGHQAIAHQCVETVAGGDRSSRPVRVLDVTSGSDAASARESNRWVKLGGKVTSADLLAMPTTPDFYDIVAASFALHHVARTPDAWDAFWTMVKGLLAPAGVFVCFAYDSLMITELFGRKMCNAWPLYTLQMDLHPDTMWDDIGNSEPKPHRLTFIAADRFLARTGKNALECRFTSRFHLPADPTVHMSAAEQMYTHLQRSWVLRAEYAGRVVGGVQGVR